MPTPTTDVRSGGPQGSLIQRSVSIGLRTPNGSGGFAQRLPSAGVRYPAPFDSVPRLDFSNANSSAFIALLAL